MHRAVCNGGFAFVMAFILYLLSHLIFCFIRRPSHPPHPAGESCCNHIIILARMSNSNPTSSDNQSNLESTLIPGTLHRLCHGLPIRELQLTIDESTACEAQLEQEIALLEKALLQQQQKQDEENEEDSDAVNAILESPLTPLHQYWTASALLGRLRHELALPSLDPLILSAKANANNSSSSGSRPSSTTNSAVTEEQALQQLAKSYNSSNNSLSSETLLAVWKKISSNRAAAVFRRAVKPEEAPGYKERIQFPMDLGLIRKRIVAGNIRTFADLHGAVALIAHNCVKYNGRESDYGRVAVDFEAMADHVILQAVQQQAANVAAGGGGAATSVATAATTTTTTNSTTDAPTPASATQPAAAAAAKGSKAKASNGASKATTQKV